MSKFLSHKKRLISEVFEKAKNETTETSFSGILKDFENTLKDDYRIQLSYKTFETYYRYLVEKNEDYNIKPLILDDLCVYLGQKNFKTFCQKTDLGETPSDIKVNINGLEQVHHTSKISDIIINITNSPVFSIPEFVSKNSQSFGLVGILLVAGFLFQKTDLIEKEKRNEIFTEVNSQKLPTPLEPIARTPPHYIQTIANIPQKPVVNDNVREIIRPREMDCMYWNNEEYVPVYCDETVPNHHVEQRKEDLMNLKKITRTDTLNIDNSIGKVWYDKTNNKVEFFTYYGVNPETGKTLKKVTKYILEKYKDQ